MAARCLLFAVVLVAHPTPGMVRACDHPATPRDAVPQPAPPEAGSPETSPPGVEPAVERGLALMSLSASHYTTQRECFSCHHQALPAMTIALAGKRGWTIDAERARGQSQFTEQFFAERRESLVQGQGVPGGAYTAGYALLGLGADGWPADETTAALVQFLLVRQEENGCWKIGTQRPPLEYSHFTSTALSLRGLDLYAPAQKRDEVNLRIDKARRWLLETEALTNEDLVFRLLGLKWARASEAEIQPAAAALAAAQREDGGWAQETQMQSDAYATGQALVALAQSGGMAPDEAVYRRGVELLLRTQQADGSWLVTTRSKPIQVYFESGFPHEKSQFISISATSWATAALALTRPEAARRGTNP